ncbi:glycine reductase complex component B subunit gamma, partial [Desulfovibrio sp. 1214_IL3152]
MAYKLVHYINQFFAGIGGEDKADVSPEVREGIVGPGMAFKAALGDQAEIVATFICGDNYCANNLDAVAARMVETVKSFGADGLIAGPAFNAGRYGTACGAVCAAVNKQLGLPVVSGMYRESPGVDLYR